MMTRRIGTVLVLTVLALACGAGEDPPLAPQVDFSELKAYEVKAVVDGDTFEVVHKGGAGTVRLLGVDAPDLPEADYSAEAATFLTNMLGGESVYLLARKDDEAEPEGVRSAYVFRAPDGLFVNLEVVRQGYGRVQGDAPFRHRELLEHYERLAKMHRKGLWMAEMEALLRPRVLEGKPQQPVAPRQADKPKREVLPYNGEWLTDFRRAGAVAAQGKRPMLLNFTGSDWCGWCMKLRAEVFETPQFQEWSRRNLVLVELDFPRVKELPEQTREQNRALMTQYGVQGFPTIVVLDPAGAQIGTMGYMPGGPDAFIEKLRQIVRSAAPREP